MEIQTVKNTEKHSRLKQKLALSQHQQKPSTINQNTITESEEILSQSQHSFLLDSDRYAYSLLPLKHLQGTNNNNSRQDSCLRRERRHIILRSVLTASVQRKYRQGDLLKA